MDFKIKPSRPAITYSIVAFVAVASYFFFLNFSNILGLLRNMLNTLTPFIMGYVMAYILNIPMAFFEKELGKFIVGDHLARLRRMLATTITILLTFGCITIVLLLVLPQVQISASMFSEQLPRYLADIKSAFAQFLSQYNIDPSFINDFMRVEQITAGVVNSSAWLLSAVTVIISSVMNTIMALVVCIIYMVNKEKFIGQLNKLMFTFVSKETLDKTNEIMHISHKTFKSYISGIILNSLIVGAMVTVEMLFINSSYALLVGIIVGITNIIPFFGPIIGAIPASLFILLVARDKLIWFLIFFFIIQQLDANIISPRIVGNSVGLPVFWVIFSLLVGGGLFGFTGMILGAPVFSVFYFFAVAYISRLHDKRQTQHGRIKANG